MRLEKIKKDREECCGTRQVVWTPSDVKNVPEAELDDMFSKKTVVAGGEKKKRSRLTEMLIREPAMPPNPFAKYAKFDGAHCYADVVAKRIRIFLSMLPAPEKDRPLDVNVIPTAKVSECGVLDLLAVIDYRCDNRRFCMSAHNSEVPTPTS
jgi:hypothetical protein